MQSRPGRGMHSGPSIPRPVQGNMKGPGAQLKRVHGPDSSLHNSKAVMAVQRFGCQLNSAMRCCATLAMLEALSEPRLPEAGH